MEVNKEGLQELMEERGLISKLRDLITTCLEKAGDVTIDNVEIVSEGLLTPCYLTCAQETLAEHGITISFTE